MHTSSFLRDSAISAWYFVESSAFASHRDLPSSADSRTSSSRSAAICLSRSVSGWRRSSRPLTGYTKIKAQKSTFSVFRLYRTPPFMPLLRLRGRSRGTRKNWYGGGHECNDGAKSEKSSTLPLARIHTLARIKRARIGEFGELIHSTLTHPTHTHRWCAAFWSNSDMRPEEEVDSVTSMMSMCFVSVADRYFPTPKKKKNQLYFPTRYRRVFNTTAQATWSPATRARFEHLPAQRLSHDSGMCPLMMRDTSDATKRKTHPLLNSPSNLNHQGSELVTHNKTDQLWACKLRKFQPSSDRRISLSPS